MRGVRYGKSWEHLRGLWEAAFRLLFVSVRGCHANGLKLVPSLGVLLYHLSNFEASSGAGGEALPKYLEQLQLLILEMYRDNPLALATVNQEQFDQFDELLCTQTQLTPVYLRFLHVMACTGMGGVVANQKLLCALIMSPKSATWAPETVLRGESVLVCMPSPGVAGDMEWTSIQELRQGDPVIAEYYTEYVHLLALVASGRTRTVVLCLERLMKEGVVSWEVSMRCLLDTELPPRVRAAYCDLITNAFVDAAPQEDRCKPDHLQVRPD